MEAKLTGGRLCGWATEIFGTLVDASLEESCLRPALAANDLLVEYCLVEIDRRLFIDVDARQSGRCGRWLSVVATLEVAMLSVRVVVDRDRDPLCRRTFLRGEKEDWNDCHTSGAIAAEMLGSPVSANCRTIAVCQRHQAAKRESENQITRERKQALICCKIG